ncbi:hypothetical protein, partial [Streptomyces albidoflavus]|uniref:hypothetical protein n=1 Tax=Streptomyces albidoflavus TaxID=1886 RepID=UPI0033EE85DE
VKLSVIVPFYNVRQFAPDTLRSLKANARDDVCEIRSASRKSRWLPRLDSEKSLLRLAGPR